MIKHYVILFLLFVLSVSKIYASDPVKLEIKITDISDEYIVCDFKFQFNIVTNDSIDVYTLHLPFKENKNIKVSVLSNEPDLFFTHGFKNDGNGLTTFNSLKKSFNFKANFYNVILPLKIANNDENGFVVNLNLINEKHPFGTNSNNVELLELKNILIQTKSILNSQPKFELAEKGSGNFKITLKENEKSLYFVLPIQPESYLKTFLAFLIIAIFIGIVASLKLITGKNESIFGLVASALILVFLFYLFNQKVIPTDFNKDLDMISLIGGGIGLSFGILLNSIYNLIRIRAIENQQNG